MNVLDDDTPEAGHNSRKGGLEFDNAQLRRYVEEIEAQDKKRQDMVDDIKSIYAEAKVRGFDVKVLRAVIKRRAEDRKKRAEFDAMIEAYEFALED